MDSQALVNTLHVTALEKRTQSLPDMAAALQIVDDETYEIGGNLLKTIKGLNEEINLTFDPIIKKAHDSHKEAIAQKKKTAAPLVLAESALKIRIATYYNQKLKAAQEEQKRLQEEANKKAEGAKLESALKAESAGNLTKAEEILNSPVITEKVEVVATTPKISGVSMRENWSAEVTDEDAFFKAVFDGRIPITAVKINESFLNGQAKLLKNKLSYPGVKVTCSTGVAASKA